VTQLDETTTETDGVQGWRRWASTALIGAFSIGMLAIWLVPGNTAAAENRLPRAWPQFTATSTVDTVTYRRVDAALRDRLGAQVPVSDALGALLVHGLGRSPSAAVLVGSDRQPFFAEDLVRPCRETPESMAVVKAGLLKDQAAMAEADKYVAFVVAPNKSAVRRGSVDDVSTDLLRCSDFVRGELQDWATEGSLPLLTLWDEVAAGDTESDPAYLWNDTHWSASGSLALSHGLLARLVADQQVSPDILDDLAIPIHSPEKPYVGDLNQLMGVKDIDFKTTISFDRPDVVTVPEKTVGPEGSQQFHYTSTASTSTLVPGKTLILGDSFLMRETPSQLGNFFADVTIANAKEFAQAGEYDRVIVERVERHAGTRDWPSLASVLK
jgi:hypothetical protein